jgi:hypothetical protein
MLLPHDRDPDLVNFGFIAKNPGTKAGVLLRLASQRFQYALSGLGIVEDMSHFACPSCGAETELFPESVVEDVPSGAASVLTKIPFDPRLSIRADQGRTFLKEHPEAPAAKTFSALAGTLEGLLKQEETYVEQL